MIFNPFTMKKYSALMLVGMLTVISFVLGNVFFGFIWAIAFMLVGLLLSVFFANLLLKNPFTQMLEGKGLLVLNLDSTGIIRPFIVALNSPYIEGKMGKEKVKDAFDRTAVFQLAVPTVNKTPATPNEKGGITIELTEKEYNEGRFAFFHYPVLLWNDQIKSIITKDFLSHQEKDSFAEHGVLYLNRQMEQLTSLVRDFGRYIVETLRPTVSLFQNKFFWIIVVIAVVVMAFLFGKPLLETSGILTAGVSDSIGGAITPRG